MPAWVTNRRARSSTASWGTERRTIALAGQVAERHRVEAIADREQHGLLAACEGLEAVAEEARALVEDRPERDVDQRPPGDLGLETAVDRCPLRASTARRSRAQRPAGRRRAKLSRASDRAGSSLAVAECLEQPARIDPSAPEWHADNDAAVPASRGERRCRRRRARPRAAAGVRGGRRQRSPLSKPTDAPAGKPPASPTASSSRERRRRGRAHSGARGSRSSRAGARAQQQLANANGPLGRV